MNMINNTEHIEDDFLKKLVGKVPDEKPPADFTSNVMAGIPSAEQIESIEPPLIRLWHWFAIAAGLAGVIYFVVSVNLNTLFNQLAGGAKSEETNYVKAFTSLIELFEKGFSGFQVTSVTLVIIIAGIILYFGDRLLKKWTSSRMNFV